jgi:hypothetical protein
VAFATRRGWGASGGGARTARSSAAATRPRRRHLCALARSVFRAGHKARLENKSCELRAGRRGFGLPRFRAFTGGLSRGWSVRLSLGLKCVGHD